MREPSHPIAAPELPGDAGGIRKPARGQRARPDPAQRLADGPAAGPGALRRPGVSGARWRLRLRGGAERQLDPGGTIGSTFVTIGTAVGLGSQAGAGYLTFGGNSGAADGFAEQTIPVTPAHEYSLELYWAGRGNPGSLITVSLTGSSFGDLYQSEFSVGVTGVWAYQEVIFEPTTSAITLRFQETTPNSNTRGPAIDSVSLNGITPAPLPSVLWLLVPGLAGLIRLARRRSR